MEARAISRALDGQQASRLFPQHELPVVNLTWPVPLSKLTEADPVPVSHQPESRACGEATRWGTWLDSREARASKFLQSRATSATRATGAACLSSVGRTRTFRSISARCPGRPGRTYGIWPLARAMDPTVILATSSHVASICQWRPSMIASASLIQMARQLECSSFTSV